jgi:hypothetical protein
MTTQAKYTWPDWMPKPQVSGYGIQPVDRRTKTDMEISGIFRVEFDTDVCQCSAKMRLDRDESAWFDAFEKSLLKQGSTWFDIPLWVSGEVKYCTVRFQDRPKVDGLYGLHTDYSMALEVKERDTMPADVAEALLTFSAAALRYASNKLHKIMHVDVPKLQVPDVWS